jgi:uncharacterized protein (DUF4415 family)
MQRRKRVKRAGESARRKPERKVSPPVPLSLTASAEERDDSALTIEQYLAIYRPLKKPVTLRLDADVIAWFKKPGPRYQTRINRALRKVMMEEMRKKD